MYLRALFLLALALLSTLFGGCQLLPTPNSILVQVDPNDPTAFGSISAALSAAPKNPLTRYTISIAAGDYHEKLVIERPRVTLIGAGENQTRLHYDAYAGQPRSDDPSRNWSTWGSATLTLRAIDFIARDLHIENSFDYPSNDALAKDDPRWIRGAQAVAVMTDRGSDRALFENVTISGYQDTLFTLAGRSLFRNSTIRGHVDFIFGAGTAIFESSEIVTRARARNVDPIGYITAPSTDINSPYGLIFINSRLTRESGVPDNSMSLGRPWHPTTSFDDGRYADPNAIGQALFINCWMDAHIKQNAWYPMGGTAKDGTRKTFYPEDARFFEYASRGPGAKTNDNRRRLSREQATAFTTQKVLGDWIPPQPLESRQVTGQLENGLPPFTIEREISKHAKRYPGIQAIAPSISDKQFENIAADRNLTYRTVGNRNLQLDLFRPKANNGSRPAVVLIHGGGWRSGDRSLQIPLARALAEAGYVAATVEYRLSGEALYPAGVHDIQAAIRWLKSNAEQYAIDPNRIAVLGASSGAQMATLIGAVGHLPQFAGAPLTVKNVDSRVNAIINIDGVADLESTEARSYEDKPNKVSYAGLWLGGRYSEPPDLWQEASPLQYAGPDTPPTLFVNSSQERFSIGRDPFIQVLGQYNTPYNVVQIPKSPHAFWLFSPWFETTRDRVIEFLNQIFRREQ